MAEINSIKELREQLQRAMSLSKCRKCGCMAETLKTFWTELSKSKKDQDNFPDLFEPLSALLNEVENALNKMDPIEYT
ncbi:hypothetical protein NVS47_09635 [Dehalobacterium formicoaceticum]|uniref:Uncharacterized protein n=1 Tax=Dehalobacterium formicoaceticum TaxID=51515 RepID=A0ABT1Y4F7_9FIRM|nr:hypothetical protein [Dehalobacterium formicoaceticum]MCR6545767.1 hypothetical protein [Dehalobacterium formicoaceticum]